METKPEFRVARPKAKNENKAVNFRKVMNPNQLLPNPKPQGRKSLNHILN
jgi:hypothetical protein